MQFIPLGMSYKTFMALTPEQRTHVLDTFEACNRDYFSRIIGDQDRIIGARRWYVFLADTGKMYATGRRKTKRFLHHMGLKTGEVPAYVYNRFAGYEHDGVESFREPRPVLLRNHLVPSETFDKRAA